MPDRLQAVLRPLQHVKTTEVRQLRVLGRKKAYVRLYRMREATLPGADAEPNIANAGANGGTFAVAHRTADANPHAAHAKPYAEPNERND